jgi:hypothetical protein
MIERLLTALLCAMLLLSPAALAQESAYDKPITYAKSLLTEVYGYTQAEADVFVFQVTDTDTEWKVQFHPQEHPEGIYTGAFGKADGAFSGASSPFHTEYNKYPGENSIRDTLRAASQNQWFSTWNDAAKAAFGEYMPRMGITPSYSLQTGLQDSGYPAAQAVDDFFLSCYGEKSGWTQAVGEWHDEVLKENSLTLTPAAIDMDSRRGIRTHTAKGTNSDWTYTVTEFLSQTPPELAQVISHPQLTGWTNLCGALMTFDKPAGSKGSPPEDRGLAAFAKGDERLLVMLYREQSSEKWLIAPVGLKALLNNRDFYIAYDGQEGCFSIEYPISGFESEAFRCDVVLKRGAENLQPICKLKDYRRINRETGYSLTIDSEGGRLQAGDYWYHITTVEPGKPARAENVPAIEPDCLEFINVNGFPKNAEECRQAAAKSYTLPDGYGVAAGAHLRAETSSHSADLGMVEPGTLVQVLETVSGNPYPWYRVQIGFAQGYMSSTYVTYGSSADIAGAISLSGPLHVAKAKHDCALKKGTGWFDGSVADLKAGTKMHVIAVCGDWLYVVIPQGALGWVMDVNGTYGYVKASDVMRAATEIQLDWLE